MKAFLFFLLISPFSFGQGHFGTLRGTVIDQDGELIPFARVLVFASGTGFTEIKGGVETDFDGDFQINNLEPGTYDIEINDAIYSMDIFRLSEISVKNEQITSIGKIELQMKELELTWCCCITMPTVILDPFGRSTTIEKEDIRRH